MDMNAFLASLTPSQRAALMAGASESAPEVPSPSKAKAKAKAKIGAAKPVTDDDDDETETVPESVSAVGKKIKANGGTALPITPPEAKRTTSGPSLTDSHGRKLPVSEVPVSVTFSWADGRETTLGVTPKQFSTGSVGGNCPGKLPVRSPDGRPLQVSLNLIYVKPKSEE